MVLPRSSQTQLSVSGMGVGQFKTLNSQASSAWGTFGQVSGAMVTQRSSSLQLSASDVSIGQFKASDLGLQILGCCLQDGGNMVLRQSGESGSGHQEHIYAVNMRCSVLLQFYPQGYEWSEADPILISQGHSRVMLPGMLGSLRSRGWETPPLVPPPQHPKSSLWCPRNASPGAGRKGVGGSHARSNQTTKGGERLRALPPSSQGNQGLGHPHTCPLGVAFLLQRCWGGGGSQLAEQRGTSSFAKIWN